MLGGTAHLMAYEKKEAANTPENTPKDAPKSVAPLDKSEESSDKKVEKKAKNKIDEEMPKIRRHVFGWPFQEAAKMQPRGGTSTGGEFKLFTGEKEQWKKLQNPELKGKDRDRAAILAMTGSYRVSFDFMETAGFTTDFKPAQPYFSWATERVFILQDDPNFISLQHVIALYFKDEDGKESGPHIIKHWRQDWQYEKKSMHAFIGNNTWKQKPIDETLDINKGAWTQAVYQVDDSPRYEATGKWVHINGKSTWASQECWRPLPRREFSVRDDYNVLEGKHEITITPNGWIHLQNNKKLLVGESKTELIAHELGINRYEEITSPDLSAGYASYKKSAPYWAEVRKKWADVYAKEPSITLHKKVDKKVLWIHHFSYASEIEENGWNAEEGKKHANETIEKFIKR